MNFIGVNEQNSTVQVTCNYKPKPAQLFTIGSRMGMHWVNFEKSVRGSIQKIRRKKKMKHKKTISIVLAICMMLTVVPMFGTTAFAASTTLAVGTDSNDAIVNALKTAANNEVVTLGGDGTVTLAAGDTVNCLVVFAPDTGKTITVDGGTFTAQNSIIQVSCADITGAVVLKNGTYTRTALCTSGSLVLDNTAFSSENCCIDIVNATVDVGLIKHNFHVFLFCNGIGVYPGVGVLKL